MEPTHEPVLVEEVLQHLEPSRGGWFVDCTVGLGGHAAAVLDAGPTGSSGSIVTRRRSRTRASG